MNIDRPELNYLGPILIPRVAVPCQSGWQADEASGAPAMCAGENSSSNYSVGCHRDGIGVDGTEVGP